MHKRLTACLLALLLILNMPLSVSAGEISGPQAGSDVTLADSSDLQSDGEDEGSKGETGPVEEEPAETETGSKEPVEEEPWTDEPGETEPGTTEPGEAEPGTAEPGTTDPEITDPGTITDPDNSEDQETPEEPEEPELAEETKPSVMYRIHQSGKGWLGFVQDGKVSGRVNQPKRIEAVKIKVTSAWISGKKITGSIEYRAYVEGEGWQIYKKNGAKAGTTGKSKRLEAVQIHLTGKLAEYYNVYYRVYAKDFGWLGWTSNDGIAGTRGYDKILSAIQVRLVLKTKKGLSSKIAAYRAPLVRYGAYMEGSKKWQDYVYDATSSGLPNKKKKLEAFRVSFFDRAALGDFSGALRYRAFVQDTGWTSWKSNGTVCGAKGKGLRLEAVEMKLTGAMAKEYSIYYRVYTRTLGWMPWTGDGNTSGTGGYQKQIEAIQIKIAPKDSIQTSGRPYLTPVADITSSAKTIDDKLLTCQENGSKLGSTTTGKAMTQFRICNPKGTAPTGNVNYRVNVEDEGWKDWAQNGAYTGSEDSTKKIQAIEIEIGGKLEKLNSVYYRVYSERYGWMPWTRNGEAAGTGGYHSGITCIQIKIVPLCAKGPSTKGESYVEAMGKGLLRNPCPDADYISSEFGYRDAPTYGASWNHQGRDYAAKLGKNILAAASGKVIDVSYSDARGNYLIIDHGAKLKTLYQHCDEILVEEGQTVMVGAVIAKVGETGICTGPHLHFEVWYKDKPVDPRLYL